MKKHLFPLAIILSLVCPALACPAAAVAAEPQVSVTIPSFPVTVNGEALNYAGDKYPFILYKDITYFPMTVDHCSNLGITVAWTAEDGLYAAAASALPSIFPDYGSGNNSAASYKAQIVSFPVHVNGRRIDNAREEYPLLLFRDITYFPMTWRFAAEEFSWDISWNDGLEIRRAYSGAFEFISAGNDAAELKRTETFYSEVREPDGSVWLQPDYDNLYYARLNYADESIVPLASLAESAPQSVSGALNVTEAETELKGNLVYYEGKPIADISGFAAEAEAAYGSPLPFPVGVYGSKTAFDGGYFLEVSASVNASGPYRIYHFIAFDGSALMPLALRGGNDPAEINMHRLKGIYPVSGGVYLSTVWYVRFLGARYDSWFVSSDGGAVNISDKFADFACVVLLGTAGDRAYLKCLYKQPEWMPQSGGQRVSPINDGYYQMERDYSLTKIYPYIAAEGEMLTPAGTLYAVPRWRQGIFNLTAGTFIDLRHLPVSKVSRDNRPRTGPEAE